MKFGKVYPLAYLVTVIPRWYYAAYPRDFLEITGTEIDKISATTQARVNSVKSFLASEFRTEQGSSAGGRLVPAGRGLLHLQNQAGGSHLQKSDLINSGGACCSVTSRKKMPERPYKKIPLFLPEGRTSFIRRFSTWFRAAARQWRRREISAPDYDKN